MIRSVAVGALALGVGLSVGACGDDDDTSSLQASGGAAGAAGGGAGGTAGGAGSGGAAGGGASGGAAGDARWGCLDEPAPRPSNELVDVRFTVVTNAATAPALDATVRACGRLDDGCSTPVAPAAQVDAAGTIVLRVPGNFSGYFEVRSAAAGPAPSFVPLDVFLPNRRIVGGAADHRLIVFSESELGALAGFAGGSFSPADPPNAVLVATALDCQGSSAAGVSFELEPAELRSPRTGSFYTNAQSAPDQGATETAAGGTFVMTNLNAGALGLAGTLNEPRRPLGVSSAHLRAGQVSLVFVSP
ncbi:MAG TPA: hypothetical protein VFS43_17810 [Polyangiaceae bacterium]|nr:hypothetical protein [Polyangiaceae bacterium]